MRGSGISGLKIDIRRVAPMHMGGRYTDNLANRSNIDLKLLLSSPPPSYNQETGLFLSINIT